MLKANAGSNSAPLIYATLLHLIEPWASSAAMLRSISFLAGTLGIMAFYFLLRSITTPSAAIAGTLLLSFAPTHIHYSHELREYSFSVLLAILVFSFISAIFLPVQKQIWHFSPCFQYWGCLRNMG